MTDRMTLVAMLLNGGVVPFENCWNGVGRRC